MANKDVSILVVEDDPDLHEIIVEYLEDEEYYVRGAESVEAALELAQKVRFDILLTDVRLSGCDGVDGFARLKQKVPGLRCIVMTGYSDEDVPLKALKSEVEDYLYKPFKLQELASVVSRVAGRRGIAAHYLQVLQSTPNRVFQVCRGFFQRGKIAQLDDARTQAFNGLFVAIRSRMLLADAANGVFSQLVTLDEEYKDLLAAVEKEAVETLSRKYRDVFDFMTALSRTGAAVLGGERLPSHRFRTLFTSVQQGKITPEQLQLAPSLWKVEEGSLTEAPELLELKSKMWAVA